MASIKQTRYIQLFDDIKNHVFQWALDPDWKKLPKSVGIALTQVMNELKIHEALRAAGGTDDREDNTDMKTVRAASCSVIICSTMIFGCFSRIVSSSSFGHIAKRAVITSSEQTGRRTKVACSALEAYGRSIVRCWKILLYQPDL